MEQKNYFNNLISNEEHFYDLPDCISECSDYKDLIEKSFALTDGRLTMESFKCSESETAFLFELIVNQKPENFEVKKISDYVDTNGLISGLNSILTNSMVKTQNRFIDLVGGPVDFGIAFISPEKEMNLAKNGMIWRNDQFYADYENIKSPDKTTLDDKVKVNSTKSERKPWWKIW
jgi:hypothetical protein